MTPRKQEPIAIVGIGCLFPKASSLQDYWQNILSARDCISEVPAKHSWSVDDFYDTDPNKKDKSWCTRGGFLDELPFDPIAYGIPPNQLESIDTSQLLSLICAREALKDAGVDPDGDGWDRDNVGVILGCTGTQEMAVNLGARLHGPRWRKALKRCGVDDELVEVIVEDIGRQFPTWTEQSFPGLLGNVVAGRITNRLNLGGTNCVVDAACASSLAAIQYAISDLATGRSDMVLTGGVDTLNDSFMFQCFTRTPAFSQSNNARPFDLEADGILIGEGIAIMAMKRLADAEANGDRIYAVIQGLGSSSDGRGKSIYAPNPAGQAKALRRTYAMADIDPATVELVEAHGTGTRAGDMAETQSLLEVFGKPTGEDHQVALGSVKSQIGHTKSTAGAAGMVKAALALYHQVLPPTAKISQPNPKMKLEDSPFYLNTIARPWLRNSDHPRRAAVSAFGFGGSNFHAILEEHSSPTRAIDRISPLHQLFLFAADSAEALVAQLQSTKSGLNGAQSLAHAARQALEHYAPAPYRVSFVADSYTRAAEALNIAIKQVNANQPGAESEVYYGRCGDSPPSLGIVFPGQGSQYPNMGRGLAIASPLVRDTINRAEESLHRADRSSLAAKMYPAPVFSKEERRGQSEALKATQWAQPAIGAISAGLFNLLTNYGIKADAFAGHSYGELVALHAAGVIDEPTLWELSRVRGEAMALNGIDRGGMAAVSGPLETIEAVIQESALDVVLANRNHPNQGVISGSTPAIAAAITALEAKGLSAKPLNVSAAFHSSLVADAQPTFSAALNTAVFSPPKVRVYANATGEQYPAESDAMKALLAQQITSPVHFVEIAQALYDSGIRVFVECGPKRVLQGLLRKTLGDDVQVIALNPDQDGIEAELQVKRALAELITTGINLDLTPLLAESLPPVMDEKLSPAAVKLSGANYLNESTRNPPLPTLPKRPAATVPPPARPAQHQQERAMKKNTSPPIAAPTTSPMNASALSQLLQATQQTLSAFQQSQERAAKVHSEFLQAHSKATDTFAQLFQTHARLVGIAGGQPLPTDALPAPAPRTIPAPLPVASAPTTINTLIPSYLRPEEPNSSQESRRPLQVESELNIATDIPPIMDAMSILGRTATPSRPAPAAVSLDIEGALLSAVAEKTGYPKEMLELSMKLESDLGIDSIKRVEIMAAVQERLPSLPEIDNERLSALQTLDEVFNCLQDSKPPATTSPTVTEQKPSTYSAVTIEAAILNAVATKTGYPQEMLELSMKLESDLGIDSIKRVEIMAAVQDQVPGLPEVDNERLASLQTLQQILDYLLTLAATIQPTSEARPDLQAAVFASVAEKTGYPIEMLESNMDMESDLGIDSIKRVEIMAAVQDSIPSLPEIDNERLSSTRTLADVVALLAGFQATEVTPGPTAAGPSTEQIIASLMDSVASKTGYPKELLSLEMDMESDLGIDSIKRVEIMAALQEQVPGLPELDNDRLSSLKTLQQVLDYVLNALGSPAQPNNTSKSTETEPTNPAPRYPSRRVPTLSPIELGEPVSPKGLVLVTRDTGDLAHRIATELDTRGMEVVLLEADWSSPSSIAAALPEGVQTVIHAAAVNASGEDLAQRVRGGFLLAKAVGEVSRFVTISSQGGHFGLRGDVKPLEGAQAGLTKTLALEWPSCTAIALDITPDADTKTIADALFCQQDLIEIGLTQEGPVSLTHPEVTRTVTEAKPPVEAGELIVVSGGARGVTAAVAIEMARRWRPHLLLLGRSPIAAEPSWAVDVSDENLSSAFANQGIKSGKKPSLKDLKTQVQGILRAREVNQNLAAIHDAGGTADYIATDVRDAELVKATVQQAVAHHGPVQGLVHGAGVLADKLVVDKTPEQFDQVFKTKVEGLESLLAATGEKLKLLALFTSVAGRYGNRGQCDYAMANETLTRRGVQLAQAGVRVKAFDWGPWDGGMVDAGLRKQFQAAGIELIGLAEGAQFFCDELESTDPAIEVIVGGPEVPGALIPKPLAGEVIKKLEENEPYLRDHQIAGSPVLPAAMALEWMARAAQDAFPKMYFAGIRDFAVVNGVILKTTGESLTLRWNQGPASESNAGHRSFHCELISTNAKLKLPKVHYRGIVDLTDDEPKQRSFPGSNGLGAQQYPYQVEEAYRRFLFHGPSLRGIENIVGYSDEGMVARLNSSAPAQLGQPGGAWKTDPVAIDCALQMMLLWVRDKYGNTALPAALADYRQYRQFSGPVTCHLVMDDAQAKRGRFHATFVDDEGLVVARFKSAEYVATPKRIAFGEA